MDRLPRQGRLRRRASVVAGLSVGLFLVASLIGSYVAVAGFHGHVSVTPRDIGNRFENVAFASRADNLALSGWLFHSRTASGRSVILVHGWHGNREDVDFAPVARTFLSQGFDVLMFDLRGSGESSGLTQTLANTEPNDLLGAHDFMIRRGYRPASMAILGNSMGAATVIEAAPRLSDVGALICDSAYTDVLSASETVLSHTTGLPGWLAFPALEFSRIWGVNPDLRPIDVVKQLKDRAFLFIQSKKDNLVAPGSATRLRDASANSGSQLLIIDGNSHLDTFNRDPSAYSRVVMSFISSQMASHS